MNTFFKKKLITPFVAVLLAICCIGGTTLLLRPPTVPPTDEQLYAAAVLDTVTIEEGEVLPLVSITGDSDMVSWRDGKILLVTVNNQPQDYIVGEHLTLAGEVWSFTSREVAAWYGQNKKGVTDWTLRLKQLVGVPPDGDYTHVTAMWARPDDVLRPAYSTDITSGAMPTALPDGTPDDYKVWFERNILWSYFDSAYPWTRLGYTYDWADNGTEYGVSEFWIRPGAEVLVEYTDTIDAFIQRLEGGEAG